jgi:hypothetical protein
MTRLARNPRAEFPPCPKGCVYPEVPTKVKVFCDASVSRLVHDTPLDAVLAGEERGG